MHEFGENKNLFIEIVSKEDYKTRASFEQKCFTKIMDTFKLFFFQFITFLVNLCVLIIGKCHPILFWHLMSIPTTGELNCGTQR